MMSVNASNGEFDAELAIAFSCYSQGRNHGLNVRGQRSNAMRERWVWEED